MHIFASVVGVLKLLELELELLELYGMSPI